MNVYKCNNCECGPCYYQCADHCTVDLFGEVYDECQPRFCPADSAQESDWGRIDLEEHRAAGLSVLTAERLIEDLGNEYYEKMPEEIRDTVLSFGLTHSPCDAAVMARLWGCLRQVDEYRDHESYEALKKMLKKMSKEEIAAAVLGDAFRAGIAWREKYLQENQK